MISGPDRERLRAAARGCGFDEARFAPARPPPPAQRLDDWLAQGAHADMGWMERTRRERNDPERVLPGVQTVLALGINYLPRGPIPAAPQAVWARYALHQDYHDTIRPGLVALGKVLERDWAQGPGDYRWCVDTGPVLERGWSARAGVGFLGKNGMLISRTHGNWLFLAAMLLRLEVEPDPPLSRGALEADGAARVGALCGNCTACLDACPTQALPRPGFLDARRCISYHTIENRGIVPKELRPGFGQRVYGCDTCLEVCPWNRFAQAGRSFLLAARADVAEPDLGALLELDETGFRRRYRGTAIARIKRRGLVRNACIAAGNAGRADLQPSLLRLARDPEPVVRAHAVAALSALMGPEATPLLADARPAESDPRVLAEWPAD